MVINIELNDFQENILAEKIAIYESRIAAGSPGLMLAQIVKLTSGKYCMCVDLIDNDMADEIKNVIGGKKGIVGCREIDVYCDESDEC